MLSMPGLALLTAALNFLSHWGHSYMPNTATMILIFLSGNGAASSHVLYWSFAGVPHSGERFVLSVFSVCEAAEVSSRLNLLFVLYFSEGFLTLRAVVESDCQLHSFSLLVWTSSHLPCFSRTGNVSSTFWTGSHLISSNIFR